MLATQSIEARAQQEGCRQACIIGLSINEDTKLRKGKEKRKQVVLWACLNIKRAAKALVASEPMAAWQNMAEVLYDPFVTWLQAHQVPPFSTSAVIIS